MAFALKKHLTCFRTHLVSLSPMGKSIQSARRPVLFLALLIFSTAKVALTAEAMSPVATDRTVASDPSSEQIPTGFKVERYARVWEHNPFTLVTPSAPQAEHPVFDKLFLTSWLNDGHRDVVFIQNMETNEVQKITAEPNQDNFRLVALHLDPNPHLVEALLSDGKEQGSVRFRLDATSSAAEQASPVAQVTDPRPASNQVQTASRALPRPQPNAPTLTSPTSRPLSRRAMGSSAPLADGASRGGRRGSQSEANHLPAPPK
jgi:hypothetical protein